MTLPVQTQAVADERGLLTPTWRRWLADLERRVTASSNDGLASDIAAIATALGSPDGTVENIPEQASTDALIVGLDGILTEGRLSSGRVTVRLVDLEDTGEGAGLYKITRDAKGRVEGTQAATAADLAYDNATSGLSATNVQAAIDEALDGAGGGSMQLVGTVTVAGAAATSLAMTGLDLAADGCYVIRASLKNASGSSNTVSMFYNGDTTTGNYAGQFITGAGSALSAAASASAAVFTMDGSASHIADIRTQLDQDGRARAALLSHRGASTSLVLQHCAHIYKTVANVTEIRFTGVIASGLAVGSTFTVWKLN